jgi:hypothetical protein
MLNWAKSHEGDEKISGEDKDKSDEGDEIARRR